MGALGRDGMGQPQVFDRRVDKLQSLRRPQVSSWQTYDVDFTAAQFANGQKTKNGRMTVRHNGVVVHDNVELPHATTSSPLSEGPEPGPINLQDHQAEVRYRNVWFVPKIGVGTTD